MSNFLLYPHSLLPPRTTTNRSRNRSILAYLKQNNVPSHIVKRIQGTLSGDNFEGDDYGEYSDTGFNNNEDDDEVVGERRRRYDEDQQEIKKQASILEKKWTSVVRLQRRVLDLESQVTSLTTELENMPIGISASSASKKADPISWLPRNPAKYSLSGHRQPITSVAFHSVFSVVASSSEDGTIKIWDWELGELERSLKGHTKAVLDLDFGGTGADILLASCSSDLTIKLWDPQNEYANIRTLTGHDHTISSVRFTPSGTHLLSASRDKCVRIWEVKTGYSVRTIRGHSEWVKTVSPSMDSAYILSGGIDQSARISSFTSGEGKLSFIGHDHVVECAAFAPPSAYAYLASIEGLKQPVPSHFSASFEYVATGSRDKTIKLWNTRGENILTLKGHDNWVRDLTFHPAGKFLLSVSDDRSIRCWDLSQRGRCVKVLQDAHHHFVSCIRWAPAIASSNDTVVAASTASTASTTTAADNVTASSTTTPSVIARYGVPGISAPRTRLSSGSRMMFGGLATSAALSSLSSVSGNTSSGSGPNASSLSLSPSAARKRALRAPENWRNMRCVIATGSVDLDVKIWM